MVLVELDLGNAALQECCSSFEQRSFRLHIQWYNWSISLIEMPQECQSIHLEGINTFTLRNDYIDESSKMLNSWTEVLDGVMCKETHPHNQRGSTPWHMHIQSTQFISGRSQGPSMPSFTQHIWFALHSRITSSQSGTKHYRRIWHTTLVHKSQTGAWSTNHSENCFFCELLWTFVVLFCFLRSLFQRLNSVAVKSIHINTVNLWTKQ